MSVIIGKYGTYWLGFGASKMFIYHVQYTSIIMIFYVQTPFTIIIHGSVHLGLSSIKIIFHIRYSSIIIIIDVHWVIFRYGAWIFLSSNTPNDKLIPPPSFRPSNPSYKRAMIVAISLWLTLLIKEGGGGVNSVADVDPFRCGVISASLILGHQYILEFHVIVLFLN